MRRFLFALLVIVGAVGCAASAPAAPTSSDPAASSALTGITPPASAAMPVLPSAPSASALLIAYRDSHNELKRVDLATGAPVPSIDALDVGQSPAYGLSPDGSQLALFKYPKAETLAGGTLELVDTKTLHSETVEGVTFPSAINLVTYSPDGKHLAVSMYVMSSTSPDAPITGWRIGLIDLGMGDVTAQADLTFSPSTLRFSPDGATIATYGASYAIWPDQTPGSTQVALLDAGDLHSLWTVRVDGLLDGFYPWEGTAPPPDSHAGIQWTPAAAFLADATKLYLVHADVDRLTTVDFGRKSILTVDIGPQKTFLDTVMGLGARVAHAKAIKGAMLSGILSADGSRLFVTGSKMDFTADSNGQPEYTNTPLGVRVIDVATGALLKTLDTDATSFVLSDDGSQLFLYSYDNRGTPMTLVVDAGTFKTIATVPDYQVYSSPFKLVDGRRGLPVIRWGSDGSTTLGVVDAETFQVISSWLDHDSSGWIMPSR